MDPAANLNQIQVMLLVLALEVMNMSSKFKTFSNCKS